MKGKLILSVEQADNDKNAWLEVRKSNNIAISLYTSQGFEIKGVRKKYYADNDEDAYVMVLRLTKLKKITLPNLNKKKLRLKLEEKMTKVKHALTLLIQSLRKQ